MTRLASSRAARLVVAAGLVSYLLWISRPADVGRALAGARLWPLLVAIALTLVDRSLMAWRWLALLSPVPSGQRPPLARVMRIFFVSTFLGTFLPASVGGDVVRAYSLASEQVPLRLSAASVLMDRALGVVSILLLGLLALLASSTVPPPGVPLALGVGAVAAAGLALFVFSEPVARVVAGLVALVPWVRARELIERLLGAVREYRYHHAALAAVLAASVAVQALRVVQAYYLGLALGLALPPGAYFVTIPVILLVMLLPVTINGLGTSQAAFLWAFAAFGVARADAFSLSVLFVALGIVGNLPGGLLYAFGRPASRPT